MSQFNSEALVTILALVGIVIMIAALLSGVIERSGFPQVAVFLLMGAALGPAGLGILNLTLASPILHIVATLSLVLVLFTDAISLNLAEVRRSRTLAMLLLGPGTLLSAALIAVLSWWLLGLSPAAASMISCCCRSCWSPWPFWGGPPRPVQVAGRAWLSICLYSGPRQGPW
jgi:NhaP-type Na+/H+ or K+/H+ antiporter